MQDDVKISSNEKDKILQKIITNLPEGYEILYASITGSHLYGTSNENSDIDVKFIFKPSLEDCVLGIASNNLNMNTSNDNTSNTKDDIDIQGWSIQFFLNLLKRGDTNALDLLYSYSNKECLLYINRFITHLFENPLMYYDISNIRGLLGFIVSQSNKYCLKGSNYSVLLNVYNITKELYEQIPENKDYYKLEYIYDKLSEKIKEESIHFKFELTEDNRRAIRVVGKVHLLDIMIFEFLRRIEKELSRYGERTKKALDGKDWKALYSAARCICQITELLSTKNLVFPLKTSDYLKDIKEGKLDFEEVNQVISSGLQNVEFLVNKFQCKTKFDYYRNKHLILNFY